MHTKSLGLGLLCLCLVLSSFGCSSSKLLTIETVPPGAIVRLQGTSTEKKTPAQLPLSWKGERAESGLEIKLELDGYEQQSFIVSEKDGMTAKDPWQIRKELQPLFIDLEVQFDSSPQQAFVSIDGGAPYKTPCSVRLRFERSSSKLPWKSINAVISKNDYESAVVEMRYEDLKKNASVFAALPKLVDIVQVQIDSNPQMANISIGDSTKGITPCVLPVLFKRDSSTAKWTNNALIISADNYEAMIGELRYDDLLKKRDVFFTLQKLTQTVEFELDTKPSGAIVMMGDVVKGTTPCVVSVKFNRTTSTSAWTTEQISLTRDNYLKKYVKLSLEGKGEKQIISVALDETKRVVPVQIASNVKDAEIKVNGTFVGTTPMQYKFVFSRDSAEKAWNTFRMEVDKQGYRAKLSELDRKNMGLEPGYTVGINKVINIDDAMLGTIDVKLEPVRYISSRIRNIEFSEKGVSDVYENVLSQVGEVDQEPMVASVSRITDASPDSPLVKTRLSLVRDDTNIVYAVPFKLPESEKTYLNLWIQDVSGGSGKIRLTDSRQLDSDPSSSPDSKFLYFTADRLGTGKLNIWRLNLEEQAGLVKITDSPSSLSDTGPALSPDGTKLLYVSQLRGSQQKYIWVSNADGTLPMQLRVGDMASWSPDGKKIVFAAPDGMGRNKIWVMGYNGRSPQVLTQGSQNDEFPIWTPDATHVIYASDKLRNEEGQPNYDIWMMRADGSNQRALTLNGSYDSRPVIARDGRTVYFLSNRGAKSEGEESLQIWSFKLPEETIEKVKLSNAPKPVEQSHVKRDSVEDQRINRIPGADGIGSDNKDRELKLLEAKPNGSSALMGEVSSPKSNTQDSSQN